MKFITKSTFQFLSELKKNNKKEWFDENRARYKVVRLGLKEFVSDLILEMAVFDRKLIDNEVEGHLFRLNRDVRFSKDKRPYKANFGVLILSGGRSAMNEKAGYYLHIEPGNSFLAGGAYLPPMKWLSRIRDNIIADPKNFKSIINSKKFKKYFEVEGAKLKVGPRGYSKDHPEIELLKYKSFLGMHRISDRQVLAPDFKKYAAGAFKSLKPFDDFLNK